MLLAPGTGLSSRSSDCLAATFKFLRDDMLRREDSATKDLQAVGGFMLMLLFMTGVSYSLALL